MIFPCRGILIHTEGIGKERLVTSTRQAGRAAWSWTQDHGVSRELSQLVKSRWIEREEALYKSVRCAVTSTSGSYKALSKDCQQCAVFFPICFCSTCGWKPWVIQHNPVWHWVKRFLCTCRYFRIRTRPSWPVEVGTCNGNEKKAAFLVVDGCCVCCCAHPRQDPASAHVNTDHEYCLL